MDEQNVVSLHCKAGKGRAGIMAACLLIRLGDTASGAVSKFDATRVSDLKGLTVVNQRKWPFLYERLVKEVWGVQDSIGMVPGQDPDLRAPAARAASLREVSVRLDPQTAGNKRKSGILPNLSCAIYQQQPMGKALLHRAKMVEVASQQGEPRLVFAAGLPRSVVVEGTFQVLVSAAVSAAPAQKNVIDLWWNTSFLSGEDGEHVFALSELDVSPLKLAGRLHQANAKLVLHHTHPHAESPRRRMPRKTRATAATAPVEQAPNAGVGIPQTESGPPPSGGGAGVETRPCASERSLSPGASYVVAGRAGGEGKGEGGDAREGRDGGGGGGGGEGEGEGEGERGNETVVSGTSTAGGDSAGGGVISGDPGVTAAVAGAAVADMEGLPFGSATRIPNPDANDHSDAPVASSPSLPGPSPAGIISPVWTFEGRTPSNNVDASGAAVDESGWTRNKMWASNQGLASAGAQSPTRVEDGVRDKRRAPQEKQPSLKATDSAGRSAGSTSAPTGTSASMRGVTGRAAAAAARGRGFPAPRGETDSESDDQLAVRASAFEATNAGPQRPMTGPSYTQYSMIEGDVKQAVRLLEMSLSGLMSAETALEAWKGKVPAKAYDDIMSCLTKGDVAPSNTSTNTISEKE
ncbi:unnamed protein product [Scytosiphon promiscuus]